MFNFYCRERCDGGSIEQMDRTRSLAASSAFDPDQDGADTLMYKHTSRGTLVGRNSRSGSERSALAPRSASSARRRSEARVGPLASSATPRWAWSASQTLPICLLRPTRLVEGKVNYDQRLN